MRRIFCQMILPCLIALPAQAQDWALGGFDPVGFAQVGHPVAGRSDIATQWRGQLWHFASEANRDSFEANPRSFLPQMDGYCPVSIAEGHPVKGDPRNAIMLDGQLYLTRSPSALRRLRQNPDAVLGRAGRNRHR
ncbi:YHS domain-containing (seleno)protein [Paracoccus sp. 1_MG-2023]|uniref:YHS domain-containing (seleno)protein n=1 Tax=unclassified Paracoccus (in: a-proteobacteria) TaxID=2688777 RepID=UPI001C08B355|nr:MULTISPECIES: YHS domain-containing (seleno)protein [unclassified Paracoccus (in: a-proteobacteria)]MBU2957141.1 hypothetical protein [Paracoccus sp. C2R09]MDO6669525.1 YHS domain-containing (seleno)protein [Paracoccus sp. 1_MG-2023]